MIEVRRSDLSTDPGALWDAWIGALLKSDLAGLSPVEAAARRVFVYAVEVPNGGHIQFLTNHGVAFAEETLHGLSVFGGDAFISVLTKSIAAWQSYRLPRKSGWLQSLESFAGLYRGYGKDFEPLDDEFYGLKPTLTDLLEAYFRSHQDQLVDLV
jgi:hypothetical protein